MLLWNSWGIIFSLNSVTTERSAGCGSRLIKGMVNQMKKTLSILLAALLVSAATGCQQTGDDHQHSFTVKDMATQYLAAERSCLAGELYFYACSICGKAGEYVWAAGDPLGHDLQPEGCSRCEWVSVDSGKLSSGHEWAYYSDGTLYLYGNGALPAWTQDQLLANEIPWMSYSVRSVVLEKGITSVGSRSFAGCSKLTSVTLPSTVTSIGESAFEGCKSLENITLPDMLNIINKNAFRGCASIKELTIPRFTVFMDGNVFAGCSSLQNLTVASGNTAFRVQNGCLIETASSLLKTAFGTATIPTDGSVKSIGDSAFEGNTQLTTLHIPAVITGIGESAFYGCSGITSITVDEGNASYIARGNCLIEKSTKKLIQGCSASTLPADGSVTEIGDYAFAGCTGLTALHLPSTVTSIASTAFMGCSGLETITAASGSTHYSAMGNCLIISGTRTLILGCKNSVIPTDGSVIRIGNGAFAGTLITELVLPDAVTEIGEAAFEDCTELKKVTFGKGITTLNGASFNGCSALETVAVADGHPNLVVDMDSLVDTTTGTLLLGTNTSQINLDGMVTTIGAYAFAGRVGKVSIFVPDSVTAIGESAFYGCSSMTDVWYTGSEEDWAKVSLGSGWSAFTASGFKINYNSVL